MDRPGGNASFLLGELVKGFLSGCDLCGYTHTYSSYNFFLLNYTLKVYFSIGDALSISGGQCFTYFWREKPISHGEKNRFVLKIWSLLV